MARSAGIVDEGMDRVRHAVDSLEGELRKVRKGVRSRARHLERRYERERRRVGRRIASERRRLEKQARRRTDRLLGDLRRSGVYKRAEALRRDAAKTLGRRVDDLWSTLNVASKRDVDRLDRRIGQIHRKLRELEHEQVPAARREPHERESASHLS